MRILHLTDNFSPYIGGLERAVESLCRHWVSLGHEVRVVTAARSDAPPIELRDGFTIHRLSTLISRVPRAFAEDDRTFFPPLADPVFSSSFRALLDEWAPDIAHSHGWIFHSCAAALRNRRIPLVATGHDYGLVCANKTLMRADGAQCDGPGVAKCTSCALTHYGPKGIPIALGMQLASRRHRQISHPMAVSTAVAEAGSAPRIRDRKPMTVVPSFVSEDLLVMGQSAIPPSWAPANKAYIFYAGALGRHKGVHVLLDAHRMLRDRGLDLDLVVAGVPHPEDDILWDEPSLKLVQNAPHAEVMGAWRAASVGVVPSIWAEPLGQVALECLAAGTPLVVSATGGLVDIAAGCDGAIAVPPGSADELAAAIFRAHTDPTVRNAARLQGPHRAAKYTLPYVAKVLFDIYEDVLNSEPFHDVTL